MALSNSYFPHDENAINDPKILKLRMKFGLEGYGVYWALIEMLYRQNGFMDKEDVEAFVFSLGLNVMDDEKERVDEIIKYLIEIGLVAVDGNNITCKRVVKTIEKRREISLKAANSIQKRWGEKYERNTNVIRSDKNTKYEGNTSKVKESKVKESKVKESKVKESKVKEIEGGVGEVSPNTQPPPKKKFLDFVILEGSQHQDLIQKMGASKANDFIDRLNSYIGSTGKRYKSHYHTILNWWRRDGGNLQATKTISLRDLDTSKINL